MDLFSNSPDSPKNLLPLDGTAIYFGKVYTSTEACRLYSIFENEIIWEPDQAIIFGKHYFTKRKVAWYGLEAYPYRYSKITKIALPFTDTLQELRLKAEEITRSNYNSCLLNLYHTGSEGMAWHSDGEKMLEKNGSIASFSFGAERKFSFKHKETKETKSILLEDGSLLEMKGETQQNWLHRLPPTQKIYAPRINLTFRKIVTI